MNRAMEQIQFNVQKEIQKQQLTYSCYTSEQQVLRKKSPFQANAFAQANGIIHNTHATNNKQENIQNTNHDSFSALSCEKLVNYCLLLH